MTGRNDMIERFPSGYPQFSALVGAHPTFSISRRFSIIRARLLLLKQQRVAKLEEELKELDLQESRPLHLGSFQADANSARIKVLKDLDEALADYDEQLKRNAEVLQLPQAPQRSVDSLLNWVHGTGSITRRETAFLRNQDLCTTGSQEDHGVVWIESLLERMFIYSYQCFIRARSLGPLPYQSPASAAESHGKRVFLFEGHALRVITHSCVTMLVVLLLLVPMVAMRSTNSAGIQMVCIIIMSILSTVMMSGPMNARTTEIFNASATYATLLVVFLSSNSQK